MTAVLLSDDLLDKDNTERPNVNYCRLSGPWASLSMGSLPLRVWIEILGQVEVEALGHTIDPCCRAQMGLGIIGPYISPPLIRVWLLGNESRNWKSNGYPYNPTGTFGDDSRDQ